VAESQGRTAIGVGANGFQPMVALKVEINDKAGQIQFHPFEPVNEAPRSNSASPACCPKERFLAIRRLQLLSKSLEAEVWIGHDSGVWAVTKLAPYAYE
jgi:hypothetical protein